MMTMPRSSVAAPRWSTNPTEGRRHRGELLEAIHRDLVGEDPMPWQSLIYRVGSEFHVVGGVEVPYYREIVATVPRQSGKSVVLLVFAVERARFRNRPQRMAYTAQTGWDARKKVVDDYAPLHLMVSPYRNDVDRVMRGAGNEGIIFKNGSRLDVLSSAGDAGHGRTLHLGIIDEAFSDTDDRREQAMLPAMATIRDAQILVFSTAGDGRSTYFRRKVDAGRAAVGKEEIEGIAYFEWSAPDKADPDDPEVWRSCMPALGLTIDESVVKHARSTMTDGEFRRAFLNQWVEGESEQVISQDLWNSVLHDAPLAGRMVVAADAVPDQSSASVAVASEGVVEVHRHDSGTSWLLDELVKAWKTMKTPVVVDKYGPVAHLIPQLKAKHVKVLEFDTNQVKRSCALILERIADRRISVRPVKCGHCDRVSISDAVAGAVRQPQGDGWKWSRKSTDVDISPLMAASLAVGGISGVGGGAPRTSVPFAFS